MSLTKSLNGSFSLSSSQVLAKPDVDPLDREQREIERRRQRKQERRERLLHPKNRIIGIDKDALDVQIQEKQERKRMEEEDRKLDDQTRVEHASILTSLEREKQSRLSLGSQRLAAFLKTQSKEKQELDRHRALEAKQPSQEITNFLNFVGEDLGKQQRETDQKQQQQEWLTQQILAQQQKEAEEKQSELSYAEYQKWLYEEKGRLEKLAEQNAVNNCSETAQENFQLAARKRADAKRLKEINAELDKMDINTNLKSEILNEKTGDLSIPYQFKGFNQQQRQSILDVQRQQMEEVLARRAKAAQDEADYADQQEKIRRQRIIQERQKLAKLAQDRKELFVSQQLQKKEHDDGMRHLKEVYTNPVAPEYFEQFGTSDR